MRFGHRWMENGRRDDERSEQRRPGGGRRVSGVMDAMLHTRWHEVTGRAKRMIGSHRYLAAVLLAVVTAAAGWTMWRSAEPLPRATWIWRASDVAAQPDQVLSFLRAERIGLVYLQVSDRIPQEAYRAFIKQAREAGVEVHALGGAPGWVTRQGLAESDAMMSWLDRYQAAAAPQERFTGVHLDVEPYQLDGWTGERRSLIQGYQALIDRWREWTRQRDLELGADIPFWYDDLFYREQRLSRWVIDHTDSVTVMAYRNQIDGPNGVLALTGRDRSYARERGKPIYLALETSPSAAGKHLAFSDYQTLVEAADELEQHADEQAGIAIHHYETFRALKEEGR